MPCQCIPPPPIFDVPPPPDPSLILHLLLDEPSTALNGGDKFQQFSAAQSCPAASSPSSVGAFFAAWWAQFERAGADFFLPWLALLLFALCLVSSGAALVLRWRRRSRKMLRDGTTEGNAANGQSRKRPSKSQNSSSSMASPVGLPMVCGGYSSSTSADSPEHFGAGGAAHFAAHSSTETMASAAASPLEQQKPQKGWLFQPNFFAAFSSPNAGGGGGGGLFRPNTVGASRRKLPSSSSHHCPSSAHRHHHFHHHHPQLPHSSCCSPPGSSQNCCPFPGSPPRTVALRMPRHFSSHEGQFVAWQMVGAENAIGSSAGSFYGFGGNEGGGSELYEELAGENEEIIAEAPYKRRQLQTTLKRMPPPSSRPPPPPPEHSMLDAVGIIGGDGGHHLEGISKGISKIISDGSSKGSSKGSLASTAASDEDVEIGSANNRRQNAEGNQTTPPAANASNGIGGGGGQSSSRTESGYGTGGRGPKRRTQEKGNNGGNGAGGLWRNSQQQNLAGHFVAGDGIRPPQNWPKDNILVDDADDDDGGPNEYVEQGGRRHNKAMTYV